MRMNERRDPGDEEFHGHAVHRFGDDRIVDELIRRPAVLHGVGDIEKWLPKIDGAAVGGDSEDLTGVERVRGEATRRVRQESSGATTKATSSRATNCSRR